MKCATLFVFIFLIFTTIHAQKSLHSLVLALSNAFGIGQREVERCIHQSTAVVDDFDVLEDAIVEDSAEINKESIRRASCAMVCCAQVQGTMTGAKINIQFVHKLIQESTIPPKLQHVIHTSVDQCHSKVKDIANECELGYRMMKCVIMKTYDLEDRQ